ncbi:hypothetical protein [Nonomuraea cavernae]|uniref:Uncharacterized protein n=1 Tax=Nonomuraea cavernae TaxID=2045107 RepID=A0A917ZHN3_9ACTN|nr:hypothetical protein [Nonomuraea cavernae]MCA2190723.1 hypothetical protein [Nonomuraea cavernae]GGO82022.1 hypothetical protein GCM10012289_72300 [Nonomuraea cavernae]
MAETDPRPVLLRAPNRRLGLRRVRRTLVVLACLVAPALVVMVPMWVNDARLNGMMERILDRPPLPDTMVSRVQGTVGLLEGNGNHCDYLVRISVYTSLSSAEIEAHYGSATRVHVEAPASEGSASEGSAGDVPAGEAKSMILEFLATDDAGWDLRCH